MEIERGGKKTVFWIYKGFYWASLNVYDDKTFADIQVNS